MDLFYLAVIATGLGTLALNSVPLTIGWAILTVAAWLAIELRNRDESR